MPWLLTCQDINSYDIDYVEYVCPVITRQGWQFLPHPRKNPEISVEKTAPEEICFFPPILEEMEETKNWCHISILTHVAS